MSMRKELWFGFSIMALVVASAAWLLLGVEHITNGHLGLLMLSLVVVAIMLGFPTAFTLMGMGMIFTWLAYDRNVTRTLDLMVQAAYKSMANDVLIAIPLFVFMGYLVERANLIEKLFKSLHLAMARVPGSLAVATLVTCAIFATATGIVGAVVTLMGLLALPAMLRAGYSIPMSAGAITAGGCLGILIPPSVLLILYGATAGVSVVQLYAGAFFPGVMLAGLYVAYVIIVAKLKPAWAPPLSAEERQVDLPTLTSALPAGTRDYAPLRLLNALKGRRNADVPLAHVLRQLAVVVLPGLLFLLLATSTWQAVTKVPAEQAVELQAIGSEGSGAESSDSGLAEPPAEDELQEPPTEDALQEPPGADAPDTLATPPGAEVDAGRLHRLIFEPGFSTASEVTELSGRGVGMDVVRAEVNAMGGRI
ncbi:MAG TPA: TRAP transporter large permease subunit, partial [Ottowia sp.]|nr:TRAP transporter large permease subunit [Ottowia sp.]